MPDRTQEIDSKYKEIEIINRGKYELLPHGPVGDRHPTLNCEKCGRTRVHHYVGVGRVYRKNIIFRSLMPSSKNPSEGVSGWQLGSVFRCDECGTTRLFGSVESILTMKEQDRGRPDVIPADAIV